MSRKGKDQLAWDEIMPATRKTLYDEAMELRATRISWNEVAQAMSKTHGIEFKGPTVSSMVKYHSDPERRAKRKKKTEALAGAAGAMAEAAEGLAGDRRSGDILVADDERPPTRMSAPLEREAKEAEEGRATGARPTRGGAPCVVHIARDGLEIWISAANDNELRVKAAQITNILDLVVRMGETTTVIDHILGKGAATSP